MKWIFIFICQFSFLALTAQRSESIVEKPILQPPFHFNFNSILENKTASHFPARSFVFQKPATFLDLNRINHYPGIFCKMEYKMQAKTKLAPRFRLGSVNYTKWMEGKGEYFSRYWN